ncbi:GumC domain-containing protein [Pedobacter duraquae]|uniref:Subunit length determinant protein n=1 Tax=Pedobacter duraquae TaxID=425511 RepID=A0A4R6IDR6_9SPHI|nr:hypothetical protein [Pedobacter duraquae]TDO20162.1 hypothetical protein CLV32_3922 [Pedobacter duraquae]
MSVLEKPNYNNTEPEEDFSFKQSVLTRLKDFNYLWKHRLKIILFCLLGGLFGALTAWKWPVTYTAKLTFIVEDSKGGGSLLSGLASQMGFDIGGLASGGSSGVLAGDNVLQLLVSSKMLKQTLLSPFDKDPNYTLADRYAESNKLKSKWEKLEEAKGPINFPGNTKNYTRLQDSLLQDMITRIGEKDVSVNKPDKKLSFFALNATMKDEKLAALFCNRLIDEASDFYIATKTKKLRTNVDRLQTRADSIGRILNKKTYSASAANSVMLDLNPAYTTAGVSAELQERDKRVLQTIYSEIIKNLEVSRTMLMQETPTFQVIDSPDTPLKKNKLKYSTGIFTGVVLAGFFTALFLMMFRKKQFQQD